jgi:hypothetical protein
MFSVSYWLYKYSNYSSYVLESFICIFWFVGLIYGKTAIIDFIVALQIIMLCTITIGVMNPGFAGMMLPKFIFFGYTGLYSENY